MISKLHESAGVSSVVREWTNIIYDGIMSSNERDRIIIDGYDHYDTYKEFGIDYLVIDFYDKITGYDTQKSGYDKDGYYVVLLYIQPQILDGQTNYDLKSALNHELKHAYQDYMRVSKGYGNIDTTKQVKEFYTDDFIGLLNNPQHTGPIKTILKYYYYLSNLERDAYLENVYDQQGDYTKKIRSILRKDFQQFKQKMLQSSWDNITQLNIPLLNKFNTPEEFIDYSDKRLKGEAIKVMKKINKLKYIHNK